MLATAALVGLAGASEAQFLFRSIDGSSNNPLDPTIGAANTALLRLSTNAYGDGLSTPSGGGMPSPRAISNAICDQVGLIPNSAGVSDFVWQWGQFLDHDLDLTEGADPPEAFHIPVPLGDPHFDPFSTGTQLIHLFRSIYMVDGSGVRQQMNGITAWIDASNVYGSDIARAIELRMFDGTGRLKTSAGDLLPFNVNGFPNAMPMGADPADFFLAGDVRANEQAALAAMHTLFVREHNFWATLLGNFPFVNGDLAYLFARAIVGAEMQAITYNEFLPALLGPGALPPYAGPNPNVNATISNVFSTACYRFGHSMLSPTLARLDASLMTIPAGDLQLADAFFEPQHLIDHGIDSLLRGLAHQHAQEIDPFVVGDVRNFLFGPPGAGGFDLASLNIQRGRDHGLPRYNQARVDFGLAPKASFAEISSDPAIQAKLAAAYASVDDVDVWVGGLAEDHVPGALVGELIHTVLVDQFTRLRDGDRFWYRFSLPVGFPALIDQQTLSVIIKRNTGIGAELGADPFHVPGP